MSHSPNFEAFAELAANHDLVPVYRRMLSDGLTPVSAFQKLDDGQDACLFESVIGGEKVGRYSILAVNPFMIINACGNDVTISRDGEMERRTSDNPLDDLRQLVDSFKAPQLEELPPFNGGAIGYAGYDVIRYVENLPNPPENDRQIPDMTFGFYDSLVVFDNVNKTMFVIVMARLDQFQDIQAAYTEAIARVDQLIEKLAAPAALSMADIDTAGGTDDFSYTSNFEKSEFETAVNKCVEYIRAGDIFQVVISQRLQLDLQVDPVELYRSLRVVNPSPFMFFLRTSDVTLVGSSPEIMCRVVDGKVTVRPLAGTRPRGATEQEDNQLAEELLADPKERAEHVMLVDLGRNDVGRIAKYRSV